MACYAIYPIYLNIEHLYQLQFSKYRSLAIIKNVFKLFSLKNNFSKPIIDIF